MATCGALFMLCMALIVGIGACAPASLGPTSAATAGASSTAFVTTDGEHFLVHGRIIKLNGYTFYPATAGGVAAWRRPSFTAYIDRMLDLGLSAGQNLARPTDYWDRTNTTQTWNDPIIWANMDYLVQAAQRRGMYVLMDLSAYKWLLMSQGKDPYDARNWTQLLDYVGKRYHADSAIAAYTIVGEPPPPTTSAQTAQLVAFYRAVTDELYAADGGRHLIAAGGFNHMEDETPTTQWWQQIDALPHSDIVAFKTYSQHDLNLTPTISAFAHSLHKPMMDEEFGMPQYMGDGSYQGASDGYNGLYMDRADFFTAVYTIGEQFGVGSFVFWNLGCQLGTQSYEVSPLTPTVWHALAEHAAVTPIPRQATASAC